MNEIFEELSGFISDALPGDELPAALGGTVDRALAAIAAAHRTSPRGARSNQATARVRFLIDTFPEWRRSLTEIERQVVEIKFGRRDGSSAPIELANSQTGDKLGITKQMVAYHLKSIGAKLESKYGAAAPEISESEKTSVPDPASVAKDPTLRNDPEWQRTLRWWRTRSGKASEKLSAQDLEFLRGIETRLSEVVADDHPLVGSGKNRPGRRRSPPRYFELRALFVEKPELLEQLTPRQREAMRIGLALGDVVGEDAELGFRRFSGRESMTKENFNYLLREVAKRLDGVSEREAKK